MKTIAFYLVISLWHAETVLSIRRMQQWQALQSLSDCSFICYFYTISPSVVKTAKLKQEAIISNWNYYWNIEIIVNIDITVCIISLSDIIDVGQIMLKQLLRSGSARSKLISIAVPKFYAAVLRLIMSMHSVPDFL